MKTDKVAFSVQIAAASLAVAIAPSCGSDRRAKPVGEVTADGNSRDQDQAGVSVQFPKLTENVTIDAKSSYRIEVSFSGTSDGFWSVYASQRSAGLSDAIEIAKDLKIGQGAVDWDTKDVPAGSYYITTVVDRKGQIRVFQAPAVVIVAAKGNNNAPFVSLVSPNNSTTRQNNEIRPIQNNNQRMRFATGTPLRMIYRFQDPDGDKITLSLRVSLDDKTWQTVIDRVPPGEPLTPGGTDHLLEWTPAPSMDASVYTLRLVASDGSSESYSEQRFIGIGDTTWNGGINQAFAANCAMSGCHDTASRKSNADFTRYDDWLSYNASTKAVFDANCVSCHGDTQALGGIRLDTFAGVSANAARVRDALVNNRMPQKVVVAATPTPTPAATPTSTPNPLATPTPTPAATPTPTPNPLATPAASTSPTPTSGPVYTPIPMDAAAKALIISWIDQAGPNGLTLMEQAVEGAVRGTRNLDTSLVKYWQEPLGSNNRNRAMPKGASQPLPPAILGKFLNWEMRGSNWNEAAKRYDGVDAQRKRRD